MSEYLSTEQAADLLHLSPRTLERYRVNGGGPAFCKAGPKMILYLRDDLDAWIRSRRFSSTAEADAAA